MTGNFILQFFIIVVGLPVVGGLLFSAYEKRLAFRGRELELLGSQTAAQTAQNAALTEQLEARVRVLEQIVTDGGYDTAAQIEALRAPRLLHEGKQ